MKKFLLILFLLLTSATFLIQSCSKGDDSSPNPPVPPPTDVCAGKNIIVTAASTNAVMCGAGGSITVTASGSTGFTFRLGSGAYQTSPVFNNVAAGSYTVSAKDVDGCVKTAAVSVNSSSTPGPLFTNVRNLINVRCVSCHNPNNLNGGKDWTVDCNIVTNAARIYQRAVVEGSMPATGPLPQSERDIIAAWFNAGAQYTD